MRVTDVAVADVTSELVVLDLKESATEAQGMKELKFAN